MRASSRSVRVSSWNVNGLRAIADKGFHEWLAHTRPDIVGIQEVRARLDQVPDGLRQPSDWHTHWVVAERPGYSGVGLLAKRKPDRLGGVLGVRRFDSEGRVLTARFGRLLIVNVYFPNGSGTDRSNDRVGFKLAFYRSVRRLIERQRRAGARVLVMGDFNTAHAEIDLARPRENKRTSGFLPEERAELDRWLAAGWVDSFRRFRPEPDQYSWWCQRGTARQRNIGWRIDYMLASPNLAPFLRDAFIQTAIGGSDHAPIGVDLDPAVFE